MFTIIGIIIFVLVAVAAAAVDAIVLVLIGYRRIKEGGMVEEAKHNVAAILVVMAMRRIIIIH